jgi:hypothetical protein
LRSSSDSTPPVVFILLCYGCYKAVITQRGKTGVERFEIVRETVLFMLLFAG